MKRLLFSLYFLSNFVFAQTEILYSKSFQMKNIDSLKLSLKNVPVDIRPSEDNQIHFNFKLEFKNLSDKEKTSFLESLKFNEEITEGVINVDLKSEIELNRLHAFSERVTNEELSKLVDKVVKNYTDFSFKKKSKEEILKKYKEGKGEDYKKFIRLKEKVIIDNNKKLIKNTFTIYLPKKFAAILKLNAEKSNIDFNDLEFKNLNVFVDGGYLKIRKINNSKLTCWNGSIFLGEVDSSIITAKSTTSLLIGGIANSNLITEHTKIEIGEVDAYTDFKDFGSRFYFYGYSNKFRKFNFKGEYSKVNFFVPNDNYHLEVRGNSTVFKSGENDMKVESKKEDKILMLSMKTPKTSKYFREFNFDLLNSEFEGHNSELGTMIKDIKLRSSKKGN